MSGGSSTAPGAPAPRTATPTGGPSTAPARLAYVLALAAPVAALAVFFVWPVAVMLLRGVDPAAIDTLTSARTWRIATTTLWMAAAGTVCSVALGVPGAYALYVCRFPGRRILRAIATIPFVLPTVVVGVAFRSLLGRDGAYAFLGMDGGAAAIVAAMVFFNFSVVVRTVGTMWAGLDPRIAGAARMLGAGPVRVFRTVTLPSLRPAIASAAALVFLFCSTAYGIVMTLGGTSTLESEIWAQTNRLNFDAAAGLSLIQFAVVAIALAVSSRASRATALKMRPGGGRRVRPGDLPALMLTAAVTLALICAPMASLVVRSLRDDGRWTVLNYQLLVTPGRGFSSGASVVEALGNSLRSAAIATIIALAIGVPLAFALARPARGRRRRLLAAVEALAMAPLGVSAVTVGFGFLICLQAPPLNMGDELVPVAQAIVAVPMVLRALGPIVRAIDPRLRDAARMLGAGSGRVLATVDILLAMRGLALATGFALAMSLGEFGASSFLAAGDNITLPVLISRLLGRPGGHNYGMAMAASVVLGLLTAAIMALCEYSREGKHAR